MREKFRNGLALLEKEQTITSLEVAEMVGKEHKNIIRDIRGYIGEFSQLNLGGIGGLNDRGHKADDTTPPVNAETDYEGRRSDFRHCGVQERF